MPARWIRQARTTFNRQLLMPLQVQRANGAAGPAGARHVMCRVIEQGSIPDVRANGVESTDCECEQDMVAGDGLRASGTRANGAAGPGGARRRKRRVIEPFDSFQDGSGIVSAQETSPAEMVAGDGIEPPTRGFSIRSFKPEKGDFRVKYGL